MLITIAEANNFLRLDLEGADSSPPAITDERLAGVQLAMEIANASILNYLEVEGDPDASSPPIWTESQRNTVRAAVFYMLKAVYDNPGDDAAERFLKPGGTIDMLLARLRTPAVA
jgi:hypothetical protein